MESLKSAWEEQLVLFEVSHPDYQMKDIRRNAILRIVSKLKDRGVNRLPSFDELGKKLNSLKDTLLLKET